MSHKLPALIERIASMIGQDRAMLLVKHAHGEGANGHVYVPRLPKPGQCLPSLIGIKATTDLAQIYGGSTIRLPRCRAIYRAQRNAEVQSMAASGATVRAIAQVFNLTDRQVHNVLAM